MQDGITCCNTQHYLESCYETHLGKRFGTLTIGQALIMMPRQLSHTVNI